MARSFIPSLGRNQGKAMKLTVSETALHLLDGTEVNIERVLEAVAAATAIDTVDVSQKVLNAAASMSGDASDFDLGIAAGLMLGSLIHDAKCPIESS